MLKTKKQNTLKNRPFSRPSNKFVKRALFGVFLVVFAGIGAYFTFFSHAATTPMVNGRILSVDAAGSGRLTTLNFGTATTSTVAPFTWPGSSPQTYADISPDGERIAQIETVGTSSYLVTRRLVDGGDKKSFGVAAGTITPKWSADGTKIAVSYIFQDGSGKIGIYVLSVATGNVEYIAVPSQKNEKFSLAEYLNDNRIVYVYTDPTTANASISVYTISDTGNQANKKKWFDEPTNIRGIAFAKKDGKVAYNVLSVATNTYSLTTMGLDGSGKKTFNNLPIKTANIDVGYLIWSPDQAYILDDSKVVNTTTGVVATTLTGNTRYLGWQSVPKVSTPKFSAQGTGLELAGTASLVADSTSPSRVSVARIGGTGSATPNQQSYLRHFLNTYAGSQGQVCVVARAPVPTQPAKLTLTNLNGVPQTFDLVPGAAYQTLCNLQTTKNPDFTKPLILPKVTVGTSAFVLVDSITISANTASTPQVLVPSNSAMVGQAYSATSVVTKTTDQAITVADKSTMRIGATNATDSAGGRIKYTINVNYSATVPTLRMCAFVKTSGAAPKLQFSDFGLSSNTEWQGWGGYAVKQSFTEYGYTAYCGERGVDASKVNKSVPVQFDAYNLGPNAAPIFVEKITWQYIKK